MSEFSVTVAVIVLATVVVIVVVTLKSGILLRTILSGLLVLLALIKAVKSSRTGLFAAFMVASAVDRTEEAKQPYP